MEDVLTNDPPPSRFFPDDLDIFSSPSPPQTLTLTPQNPENPTFNPDLLIILISPSSLFLLPPSKTLITTLPSPSISFFSAPNSTALFAAVNDKVNPDVAKAVAKLILNEFEAERVLVLDSLRGENYRGRLSGPMAFRLETRGARGWLDGVERLGSGSLVEGLGAAVMVECEMRRRKAGMVVTWPEGGREVGRMLRGIVKGLGVEVGEGESGGGGKSAYWLDSGLYT